MMIICIEYTKIGKKYKKKNSKFLYKPKTQNTKKLQIEVTMMSSVGLEVWECLHFYFDYDRVHHYYWYYH